MKSPRKGIVEDPENEQSLRSLASRWESTLLLASVKERKRVETGRGRIEIRFLSESSTYKTAVLDPEGSFSNGQDNIDPGDKI